MRFTLKPKNVREWHPWFAWYPVKIQNEVVWLEKVQRKYTFFWDEAYAEYR
jgi:hypothetical protein